jgi:type IV fimbrial biogenesis protein FimT
MARPRVSAQQPAVGRKNRPPVVVNGFLSGYFAVGRDASRNRFSFANKAAMDISPCTSPPPRSAGFTLTLLAILIALVAPSFQGVLRDSRAAALANVLVGSLMLARSEAVKRNAPVVLCRSNTGTSCAGSEWEDGWLVWADTNGDGTLDADEILQVQQPLEGRFDLSATASAITYRPDGSITGAADAFELAAPGGDTEHGRCIAVDVTGRPSVTKGACP